METPLMKALVTGVSIFLMVAIIGIVVFAFNIGSDASKSGSNKLNTVVTDLNEQDYMLYDNMEVSGSAVINALKKLESDGKDGKIGVKVKTKTNEKWYYGQLDKNGGTFTPQNITGNTTIYSDVYDNTKAEYINPGGTFKGKVERDANNAIRAIIFEQK